MSRPVLYRDDSARWGVVHADALQLVDQMPAASVDAIITDPPYGIGFQRAAWDRPTLGGSTDAMAFSSWTASWAAACQRVLKPGGHLVAFGAPRTFHRLAVGIEDGGLEVRDTLLWLCGQGVPKGRRLPGGFSTTLKPGYEPILLARAPLEGRVSDSRARWGTGALSLGAAPKASATSDRWPANVLLSHTTSCRADRCSRRCPIRLVDRARPDLQPSRFFYAAKATTREREAGCERLPRRSLKVFGGGTRVACNVHPTVKPLDLMRWLVRLVCPEGGVVLDPFAGSGSTGAAAVVEGRGFLGIEREPDYVEIAVARISHWSGRNGE